MYGRFSPFNWWLSQMKMMNQAMMPLPRTRPIRDLDKAKPEEEYDPLEARRAVRELRHELEVYGVAGFLGGDDG